MLRVDAVRVVAVLLLQTGLIATVSGAFDYYATYPGYDDYCIGGELENETFIFDGKDSYVSIGLPVPDLTEFTFCWWMRSIANDSEATIVSYFAPGNDSILVKNVSNLVLSIGSEDGPQSGVETNYGLWHHVCVLWTSEGGEYKIYKDGWELFKEEGLAVNKTIYGGGDITLGNDGDLFYEGELTQFNMWNYTLTEDEIRALSEDSLNRGCGNVVFWSALTSSDLSCIETKETELPKHQDHRFACLEDEISPRVVDFDGVSSYLTVSVPIPELSQFTICFWIKAKVTYTSDWQTIFSYFVEGDTVGSIALQKLDDLELVVRNEEGKSSDESVSDGQWHHVCVMWNSKNGHHTYVVDGDSKVGRKLAKGLHVHGGGTLVLGQMQTGLNETFAEEHALSAVVSHFNVWTIKLLQSEMKAMFFYPCNRTCGNLVWWPHIIAMESTTALIRAPEGESDLFSCDRTDPCDPGVFDDKLWEIDNTGDWSLAPMPKRIPHLKAFTICFWMRLDDDFANQTNTAFSYFVPGDTEGSIVLENVNNLVVIVNNERSEPTGVNLNNQTSHFICLAWKSRTGTYTIYDKSTVLYEGHGLAVDTMVPGGGSLIIGQRQSNISTGFNKMDSYYGKLRYFNFFSKALKKREVKLATKACDPACGDVISWHELRYVDLINIRVRKLTCGGGGLTTVATTFPMSTIGTTQTEVYTEQPTTESFETFAPVTSVPPKTWSTLPGPLSTLPSTISTPPEVPSTLRSTVSTPPEVASALPSTISTPPEVPSTLPSTMSTPPEVPSTLPSTMSTTPQAPSTLRSTVSTPPEVPSTLLSTISTPPEVPSTLLSTMSTPPEVPSTLPSTMSTTPEVPSTVRSTVSTPPEVPSTLPSTMPTPPEVPSTLRSTVPTPPEVTSTLPSTMPTPSEVPSTLSSTISTPPEVASTLFTTTSTPIEKQTTQFTPMSTLHETQSTSPEMQSTLPEELTTTPKTQTTVFETFLPTTTPTPQQPKCLPEEPGTAAPCPDISGSTNRTVSLDEIPRCFANVACGKYAEQSSGYWYTNANSAVDCDTDSIICLGSCTFTQLEYEPWVRIDLVKSRLVHYVTLTNADDCCDEGKLLGAQVRIGNFRDFRKNHLCGTVADDLASSTQITMQCSKAPIVGRYVTLQILCRTATLCLCELQVWTDDFDQALDWDNELHSDCLQSDIQFPQDEAMDGDQSPGYTLEHYPGVLAPISRYLYKMFCSQNVTDENQ